MVDTARSFEVLHTATGMLFAMASPGPYNVAQHIDHCTISEQALSHDAVAGELSIDLGWCCKR